MWFSNFRLKLFTFHFIFSLFIGCLALILVFFVWYPSPLAKAVGVIHVFLMMLVIDVILGPFLTLLIAKEGKKSLKFDLACILLIQVSALFYGMYNIAISRPAWIVFDKVRFDLVQVNDIPYDYLSKAQDQFNHLPLFGVNWAAVKDPATQKEKENRIFLELEKGVAPTMMPNLYMNLSNNKKMISANSEALNKLNNYNAVLDVKKILSQYPNATAWLPLKASTVDMVVLINKEKAEVIKIVDLRPWN